MTATLTVDVFSTLDGYGSPGRDGDWGAYWGQQGPELLAHREAAYGGEQRLLLGADTFRLFEWLTGPTGPGPEAFDRWAHLMRTFPTTVVSSTLEGSFDWPDVTVVPGDAVATANRMKEESDVPIRTHGSLTLNRALLAAGVVDRLQVTIFPVVNAGTGDAPVFPGAGDLDLELLESHTLDGRTTELTFRPSPH